jgi:hypothetical protein
MISNFDDFVKSPTSALRFISLSLRRTISTPHDTRFARLEFGTYYKVVCKVAFYEPIKFDYGLSGLSGRHLREAGRGRANASGTSSSLTIDRIHSIAN